MIYEIVLRIRMETIIFDKKNTLYFLYYPVYVSSIELISLYSFSNILFKYSFVMFYMLIALTLSDGHFYHRFTYIFRFDNFIFSFVVLLPKQIYLNAYFFRFIMPQAHSELFHVRNNRRKHVSAANSIELWF